MQEGSFTPESESHRPLDTRRLFYLLSGYQERLLQDGFTVEEEWKDAEKGTSSWRILTLRKENKELQLRAYSSLRENAGSAPSEISVASNTFTEEELQEVLNILPNYF